MEFELELRVCWDVGESLVGGKWGEGKERAERVGEVCYCVVVGIGT